MFYSLVILGACPKYSSVFFLLHLTPTCFMFAKFNISSLATLAQTNTEIPKLFRICVFSNTGIYKTKRVTQIIHSCSWQKGLKVR